MAIVEHKIKNREVMIDPYITNSTWLLNAILLTYDILGVHQEYFGFPLFSADQPVDENDPDFVYGGSRVCYDTEHFNVVNHKRGKNPVLYARTDSKYYQESRLLSKIDLTLIGRDVKVPYYTKISPKAKKLNIILDDISGLAFDEDRSPGYIEYNDRYYEYVNNKLVVKEEFANYILV